jgi:hypothetical protein
MGTHEMVISENNGRLFAGFSDGTQVGVSQKYYCLPFAFADGCLQFIDDILQ